jgi:hypothetical protein
MARRPLVVVLIFALLLTGCWSGRHHHTAARAARPDDEFREKHYLGEQPGPDLLDKHPAVRNTARVVAYAVVIVVCVAVVAGLAYLWWMDPDKSIDLSSDGDS